MIPTTDQLGRLRTHPQATKLYLSVYQPQIILTGTITGTPSKGDRTITYSLSSGGHALVLSGMTMYVGSSAGEMDKGTVRVRSATAASVLVAENSHINWANGDYITIVAFFEINAVYPRIIQDPADDEKTIWYKDYDIAYASQNSDLGSLTCMGSHYAGMLENGICQVYYSASGTYDVSGGSPTFEWFFEGADTTGSSVNTPGYIDYSTPGHYTTRLAVTNGNGAVDNSYRHISIYDRPGGANPPITQWEMQNLSGSRSQGGYTGKIIVREAVDPDLVRDGSLVVIFSEDWFGDLTEQYHLTPRSNIFFVGYVLKGTVKYNYRTSAVEFEVGFPTEVMKLAEGFSVSVQYSNDPSTATNDPNIPSGWVALLDMDMRVALYHYLRWHSTVLMTNDFEFIGIDRIFQFFDTDRTSLYDAVQSAVHNILLGDVVCDRSGKLWAETPAYIQSSKYLTSFTLDKQDWIGDVDIEENRTMRTSFIEMGGVYFDGGTGSYPYLSQAPGVSPGYRGRVERIQGLALLSQSELNSWSGRLFAQRNSTYPLLGLSMAGNYQNFDIAPQEFIPVTLAADDTIRGITFTNKRFLIDRIEWNVNHGNETILPVLSLYEYGIGVVGDSLLIDNVSDGDTIIIPPTPDPEDYYQPPPIIPPVIPPIVPPFSNWSTSASQVASWTPILTANNGGTDVFPDPGTYGAVGISQDASYANVVIGFPPHNTGAVSIELLYYQIGFGGLVTINADATAYNIGGLSADTNSNSDPFTATGNRFKKSTPLALSWSGETNVCAIEVNYTFDKAGTDILYLIGIILTWTA